MWCANSKPYFKCVLGILVPKNSSYATSLLSSVDTNPRLLLQKGTSVADQREGFDWGNCTVTKKTNQCFVLASFFCLSRCFSLCILNAQVEDVRKNYTHTFWQIVQKSSSRFEWQVLTQINDLHKAVPLMHFCLCPDRHPALRQSISAAFPDGMN